MWLKGGNLLGDWMVGWIRDRARAEMAWRGGKIEGSQMKLLQRPHCKQPQRRESLRDAGRGHAALIVSTCQLEGVAAPGPAGPEGLRALSTE
jgi:hypothetical protein